MQSRLLHCYRTVSTRTWSNAASSPLSSTGVRDPLCNSGENCSSTRRASIVHFWQPKRHGTRSGIAGFRAHLKRFRVLGSMIGENSTPPAMRSFRGYRVVSSPTCQRRSSTGAMRSILICGNAHQEQHTCNSRSETEYDP